MKKNTHVNTYIVAYEHTRSSEELTKKVTHIAEQNIFNKINNVFIFNSLKSVVEIRDYLLNQFGENEQLLVFELTGYAAWNTDSEDSSNKLTKIFTEE